ncbi:hypothetical protein [Sodalis sp. dw_96]|uniref:hypothetical protein n=1 Tax=Sodalis sp. dw_96 TaxID=2719794 RepID=UPI001BD674EE|nr:hypothetical protein [Sodalis sp. dw_96]
MAKAKDKKISTAPKSNAERQATRRAKLTKKIGPAVAVHMADDDKMRLDRIAKILTGNKRPGTQERSLVIAELINQYYTGYVMKRTGKISEYIYDKYCEIWEMQITKKMEDKDIATLMNKSGERVPTKINDGFISLEKREWQEKDAYLYRSAKRVYYLLKKANKTPDK